MFVSVVISSASSSLSAANSESSPLWKKLVLNLLDERGCSFYLEGGGEVMDGDVRPAGRAGMEVEAGGEDGVEAGAGSR